MVSWGEILFTVTAASYLLGRRELPKIGRFVGLYSGRSVGAIIRAKKEFFDATKDHEIVRLQREFQKGLNELNEIRSELTSVGSMARPHQPTAMAPVGTAPPVSAAASAAYTGSAASYQASNSAGGSTMPAAATAIRPSVDVATMSESNEQRSEIARLALAELKLAERGTYATRIESLEGGADYVAASIVDSMLLDRVGTTATSKKTESSKP